MKKSIIIYSIVALSLPAFTSCEKYLDLEPAVSVDESEAIRTGADVEALLAGAYSDMGSADVYGGSLQVVSELLASGNELQWTGSFETYRDVYRKTVKTVNAEVANIWIDAYKVINDANNVLGNINLVNETKRPRVEGEAKFLRGTMYFELVRLFAKPWHQGNPAQNDGVPLMLEAFKSPYGEKDLKARAKVSEVYAQILKDLTDAESMLEYPEEDYIFAHKIAAQAMLARVYLQQGDYPNAAAAANRALQTNITKGSPFSLMGTYSSAFPYKDNASAVLGNTKEDVFATQVSNTDGVNDFHTYFSYRGRGDIYVTEDHINLYEGDDQRLNLFSQLSNGAIVTGKFDNPYASVHLIRLAEIYLTRAEANFRMGTSVGTAPVNDINRIRERAGLTLYDAGDLTLDLILKERKLELAFEGFNLNDAKRTQTNIGSIPWDSPLLVLPIPERERLVNKLLTQNDGYGN